MDNKVLIECFIPYIETTQELYVPVNKKIGTLRDLIIKSINQEAGYDYLKSSFYTFYNKDTGKNYDMNKLIIESDIRNGTRLILL